MPISIWGFIILLAGSCLLRWHTSEAFLAMLFSFKSCFSWPFSSTALSIVWYVQFQCCGWLWIWIARQYQENMIMLLNSVLCSSTSAPWSHISFIVIVIQVKYRYKTMFLRDNGATKEKTQSHSTSLTTMQYWYQQGAKMQCEMCQMLRGLSKLYNAKCVERFDGCLDLWKGLFKHRNRSINQTSIHHPSHLFCSVVSLNVPVEGKCMKPRPKKRRSRYSHLRQRGWLRTTETVRGLHRPPRAPCWCPSVMQPQWNQPKPIPILFLFYTFSLLLFISHSLPFSDVLHSLSLDQRTFSFLSVWLNSLPAEVQW